MAELGLRNATIDDCEDVHAALADLADFLGERELFTLTLDDLRTHGFGENPAFRIVIAEVDRRFAGLCLYFTTFSTWYGTPGIYVQDLYVAPAHRGRMLGEKLLSEVARQGHAQGCTHMRLSVDRANKNAIRFYNRLGMAAGDKEQIMMVQGIGFDRLAFKAAN